MKKKLSAAVVLVMAAIGGGVALAGTGNDVVLKEDKYIEMFKKEGNGDKNYLYTITEFTDKHGRKCTVVSGDSEQTIALDCDYPEQG